MVSGIFENLLKELAQALKIKELHPDSTNVCRLKFKSGVIVQLEIDKTGQFLTVASDVGTIPEGRYRENVFREALKANALPPPNYGVFCYSKHADKLVLMGQITLEELNGLKIMEYIVPFSEKVNSWKEAISHNEVPSLNATSGAASHPAGLFGLRP